ncbi:hypothetical protein HU200_047148 [Digitaria exilis]|uniref:Uncharacterized protein n=1 Tax=Digitaria exilis TaxID=1010633 RepID=A0A835AUS3_9POAL|nr:hypothetical protein HU200_047148 [Digitaria exilis]
MSDCAAKRFAEEFQILSSQSDLGLPIELIKARVSERLMLEVSNAGPSVGKTHQFSSKMWSITHDVYQGVECKDVDPVGRPFESSMMQKNVNLYAANTVVSERFSFHKFSDISANSRKVLSSENLSSELDHFPMLEINRKIDSILKPRRSAFGTSPAKSFAPQKDLKVNMSTSNALAFSSKEYQLHSHRMVDENMSRSCGNMGSSLLGAQEHFVTETDALYSGTLHASAFASTSTDKIPHLPCSKRSKVGDGLKPGVACAVFGQELNFDMENADMIKQAKEVQLRWCQGGTPISHGASNIEKQSPKFNVPPDDLEGQFPSIAAMAMMGRTMNKLRPCELQKRGPSVVWKTQGL